MKLCQARITRGPAELSGLLRKGSGKTGCVSWNLRREAGWEWGRGEALRTRRAGFENLSDRLGVLGEDGEGAGRGRALQVVLRRKLF